jgi:hypothetical protein
MRLAPLALVLALTGCVVVPARPPPPPPRPAGPISEQQAVDVAADYARARGLLIQRTTRAVLDGRTRWHIDLTGPDSHANVLVDGLTGAVLKARLRRGPPPTPVTPVPAPSASPPPMTSPPPGWPTRPQDPLPPPPPSGPAVAPAPAPGQPPVPDADWDE